MLMPFYVFAWIGAFAYGFVSIISKLTGKYSVRNPWFFNFFYSLFALVMVAFLSFGKGVVLPNSWSNVFLVGLTYALFGIFFILAIFKLDVTTFIPLFNLRGALTAILAAIFLGEPLNNQKIFLVGVIFVAGIFLSIDERLSLKSFYNKHFLVALMAILSLTVNSLLIKQAMSVDSYWTVTFWQFLISQILLLATIPFFWKDFGKFRPIQLFPMLLVAMAQIVGDLATNKAYSVNAGVSSIIVSIPVSMFMALILSLIFPQLLEKHTLKVYLIRFTSASVMIISALKLQV